MVVRQAWSSSCPARGRDQVNRGSLVEKALYGWTYVFARRFSPRAEVRRQPGTGRKECRTACSSLCNSQAIHAAEAEQTQPVQLILWISNNWFVHLANLGRLRNCAVNIRRIQICHCPTFRWRVIPTALDMNTLEEHSAVLPTSCFPIRRFESCLASTN